MRGVPFFLLPPGQGRTNFFPCSKPAETSGRKPHVADRDLAMFFRAFRSWKGSFRPPVLPRAVHALGWASLSSLGVFSVVHGEGYKHRAWGFSRRPAPVAAPAPAPALAQGPAQPLQTRIGNAVTLDALTTLCAAESVSVSVGPRQMVGDSGASASAGAPDEQQFLASMERTFGPGVREVLVRQEWTLRPAVDAAPPLHVVLYHQDTTTKILWRKVGCLTD